MGSKGLNPSHQIAMTNLSTRLFCPDNHLSSPFHSEFQLGRREISVILVSKRLNCSVRCRVMYLMRTQISVDGLQIELSIDYAVMQVVQQSSAAGRIDYHFVIHCTKTMLRKCPRS